MIDSYHIEINFKKKNKLNRINVTFIVDTLL